MTGYRYGCLKNGLFVVLVILGQNEQIFGKIM
jgi:hypothetical protein